MVSFEIFVKAMPPSLSELKVLPSFCFAFKIPDNVATSSTYVIIISADIGFLSQYRAIIFMMFVPSVVNPVIWMCINKNYNKFNHNGIFVLVLLILGLPSPFLL